MHAVALLVLTAALLSPAKEVYAREVHHDHPSAPAAGVDTQAKGDDRRTKPPSSGPVQGNQITAEAERKDNGEPSRKWELGLTFAIAVAAMVQAGGSIVQICIYRKQSRLMLISNRVSRRSANAARASADAAKDSADAYRASERPFLMIEARGEGYIEFWAVNHGRSPAHLIFCNTCPFIGIPKLEELPEKLNYGSGWDSDSLIQINVQWIAPKGEMLVGTFDPTVLNEFPSQTIDELTRAERVLIVYSALKYRGVGDDKTFVSAYCYRRFGGKLQMWGAYGWNQYT